MFAFQQKLIFKAFALMALTSLNGIFCVLKNGITRGNLKKKIFHQITKKLNEKKTAKKRFDERKLHSARKFLIKNWKK